MISGGSCDTEDWSNDAENSDLITGINYILFVCLFVCLFIYIAQFNTTHVAQSASQSQAKKHKIAEINISTSHKHT